MSQYMNVHWDIVKTSTWLVFINSTHNAVHFFIHLYFFSGYTVNNLTETKPTNKRTLIMEKNAVELKIESFKKEYNDFYKVISELFSTPEPISVDVKQGVFSENFIISQTNESCVEIKYNGDKYLFHRDHLPLSIEGVVNISNRNLYDLHRLHTRMTMYEHIMDLLTKEIDTWKKEVEEYFQA